MYAAMDVIVLAAWLCLVAAEMDHDLAHIEAFIEQRKYALKRKYRPLYHVSAPVGWLNDPSAAIYFKRQYHIFYQYHPYNGAWGAIHWGHAISDNLVDWAHYPPALVPKENYDRHGCLAGSAVIHNGYLTLFYTGSVQTNNRTYQSQNIAISSDGIAFQKYLYNPAIKEGPYNHNDFRNPKVWRFRNSWYMIVGTTAPDRMARLVLYTSTDLFNWRLNSTIARSYGEMGFMWENPDFLEVDGYHILILSVQGMRSQGYRFRNVYQSGYVIGNFNYNWLEFNELEVSMATFQELDYGHDFYAPKTMHALDGRKLLVAWLGMWDTDYQESKEGWASMLTIVRELKLSPHGRLLTVPVKEMIELRSELLEDAWYSPGESFFAGSRAFELIVNSSSVLYDAMLIFEWNGDAQYILSYSPERGHVAVDRGGIDGVRRADWLPIGHIHWRIFVDYSSIEVFCGAGEIVFSSRIYPKKPIRITVAGDIQLHVIQYGLRRSVGYTNKLGVQMTDEVLPKFH